MNDFHNRSDREKYQIMPFDFVGPTDMIFNFFDFPFFFLILKSKLIAFVKVVRKYSLV
jgi:hypothetical protein